ncbi:hypothetical protein yc1106_05131 [Curvularia clavata]|uniref:Uncharacterized protein n=1 Tax=Curvularia clavata TaxID=95742 RepID=A0A9Q9DSM1_CURCL|nr:hypothetical protein yc1106_05131 [Curvularia clavata]
MFTQEEQDIIKSQPIGKLLEGFRETSKQTCIVVPCDVYSMLFRKKSYAAFARPTTPPPSAFPILSIRQTPGVINTSSFQNTAEERRDLDGLLRTELDDLKKDIPNIFNLLLAGVPTLKETSEAVFAKYKEGNIPLYKKLGGWQDWPW